MCEKWLKMHGFGVVLSGTCAFDKKGRKKADKRQKEGKKKADGRVCV